MRCRIGGLYTNDKNELLLVLRSNYQGYFVYDIKKQDVWKPYQHSDNTISGHRRHINRGLENFDCVYIGQLKDLNLKDIIH